MTITKLFIQGSLAIILLLANPAAVFAIQPGDKSDSDSWIPSKEHLSADQVYQMIEKHASALGSLRGKFVTLDVVIKIEGAIPIAVVKPEKTAVAGPELLLAALVNDGSEASSLKKGQRYQIEGIIVDIGGYGSITIYLYHAKPVK